MYVVSVVCCEVLVVFVEIVGGVYVGVYQCCDFLWFVWWFFDEIGLFECLFCCFEIECDYVVFFMDFVCYEMRLQFFVVDFCIEIDFVFICVEVCDVVDVGVFGYEVLLDVFLVVVDC